MRALLLTCAALSACSHATQVHPGNLIELDAAPGTAEIAATSGATSLTLTVPVMPWQGRTVAAVPMLPVAPNQSWSLTYTPASGHTRSVTLVARPASGVPGAAVLQFVDEVSRLGTTIPPPTAAEALAVFNRDVSDLASTASLLTGALTQAQTALSPVGSWRSVTLNFDQSGLQYLDGAVASAQEPPISLFSPALTGGGKATAAFTLLLDAGAVIAMPGAADYSATVANPTALAGDFIVEVLGMQLMPVLLAADRVHDAEAANLAALYGYGAVHAQAISANHAVESNGSGSVRAGAHSAARVPPVTCNPAACITGTSCLACNEVFNGCFAAGASCCGTGFWSIACEKGASCAICNGIWTCLPPGGVCPSALDTYTVAGSGFFAADAGFGDAGPSGPQPCGAFSTAGSDAPDQHVFDLGKDAGSFVLDWNNYPVMDQIRVSYENRMIFDSTCTAGIGSRAIPFRGASTQITVSITPDCKLAGTTQWEYTVSCPP